MRLIKLMATRVITTHIQKTKSIPLAPMLSITNPSHETTQDGPQAPIVGSSARNGMVKWKQAWRD